MQELSNWETLLRERRLRPAALEAELLPGLAMRAFPRPALMPPAGIWVEGPEPDDRSMSGTG